MKKKDIAIPLLLTIILIGAGLKTIAQETDSGEAEKIERGRYLVTIAGCGMCHTPKITSEKGVEEDTTRLLSGHPANEYVRQMPDNIGRNGWLSASNKHMTAWAGPWGISYASNLTSDENTGIGLWTERNFLEAMRNGKHGGITRPIYPPMPWESLGKATDEDLLAILAYLKSTKPIENRVPEPYIPKKKVEKKQDVEVEAEN